MTEEGKHIVLVADACVLIDYCEAECTDVLVMLNKASWTICVPTDVLAEVDQLTETAAKKLGIQVIEPTLDQYSRARARGGPSRQDKLCFAVAQDEGWGVWTNDRRLRTRCIAAKLEAFWGLEVMLHLHSSGILSRQRAEEAAWAIHGTNSHHVTKHIVEAFVVKLSKKGELKGKPKK